ncbi:MAG TPA: alpha/beta fold hydrolase, partial [Vicinamibacteria bacterium]
MRARLGSADLEYQVRGEGPTVLFLHAFPMGLAMWEDQALALQATHRVVRFDARGFGGSPPGDGLLSMERIADDAVALLDHLGLSRAIVVGLSMGGYAALALV